MFKKILSTAMSLFLVTGISCSSASASFPRFFFSITTTEEKLAIQNFLNRYKTLIAQPLDALIRTFKSSFSFNYIDPFTGDTYSMIFCDNAQAINLAARINLLRLRLNFFTEAANSLFSENIEPGDLPSLSEFQQYNTEINSLIAEVKSLPANKPKIHLLLTCRCLCTPSRHSAHRFFSLCTETD